MAYDAGWTGGQAHWAGTAASGFVTLPTTDLGRARRFYEPLAREIGIPRSIETEGFVGWGVPYGTVGFGIALPDAAPEPVNGLVPLQAEDPEQVRRLYAIALSNGGAGEAPPCDRGGFFLACFRDPDGNRLSAFCMTAH